MTALRTLGIGAAVLLGGCASGGGWDPVSAHPEPLQLPRGMDDRSPHAYFEYGKSLIERSPARAADAFYWAHRLDPQWAEPLYARRIALFMSRPSVFERYLDGSRNVVSSPGVQRLDSLFLRALVLNPFLMRQLDATALRYLIIDGARRENPQIPEAELRYALDTWLQRTGFATRGWLAQSEGRLSDAAGLYERALGQRKSAGLMADLARVYFMIGRYDDARRTMGEAIALLHEKDDSELVRLYDSKALYEYSLGLMLEQLGDDDGARQAYARALQEDLSHHPSHMRLGEMALEAGDTATALSEMALAADISADAGVLYRYGLVLAGAGQDAEAERQFRAAIDAEPYFAAPHFQLARTLERLGRGEDAASEYAAYLEKSARGDSGRADAEQRLKALGGAPASGG